MRWALRQIIAEEWAHFYNAAFPSANAGAAERECLQMVYYAGAHAMLFRLVRALADGRHNVFDDLKAELNAFARTVTESNGESHIE
jgi:hypothetical protein